MFNYPDALIDLAAQRQRDLIDEAQQYRLRAKARKVQKARKASAR